MLMVELTVWRERTAPGPGVWEEILRGSGVEGGVGEGGGEATAVPHHLIELVHANWPSTTLEGAGGAIVRSLR